MLPSQLTPRQKQNEAKKLELIKQILKSLKLPESFNGLSTEVGNAARELENRIIQDYERYMKRARRRTVYYVTEDIKDFQLFGKQLVKNSSTGEYTYFSVEGSGGSNLAMSSSMAWKHGLMKEEDLPDDIRAKIGLARLKIKTKSANITDKT